MSHWFDEINKTSYYVEQVIIGNEKFEQDKFIEAIKILQEGFCVCHDYAHLVAQKTELSDNPDRGDSGAANNARTIYKRAYDFNVALKKLGSD